MEKAKTQKKRENKRNDEIIGDIDNYMRIREVAEKMLFH